MFPHHWDKVVTTSEVMSKHICPSIVLSENIWYIFTCKTKEGTVLSAVLKTQSVSMWQRHYNSSILVQKAARLRVWTSAVQQHGSGPPADCLPRAGSVTEADLSITPPKCILFTHGSANCSTTTAAPVLVHRWSPETTAQVVRIKPATFRFMDSVWCF